MTITINHIFMFIGLVLLATTARSAQAVQGYAGPADRGVCPWRRGSGVAREIASTDVMPWRYTLVFEPVERRLLSVVDR